MSLHLNRQPLHFSLPSETVTHLGPLDYEPHFWPVTGRYESELAYATHWPSAWEQSRDPHAVQWAERSIQPFETLVYPHARDWVHVDCIAALIPFADNKAFFPVVNGIKICSALDESQALRLRMLRAKMPFRITLAAARIEGGGLMPHGERRNYMLRLDMKRFRPL